MRLKDYNGFTPDEDTGHDKLAEAFRALLDAIETATRQARAALDQASRQTREDPFAEAIARSLRGDG